MLNFIEAQKIEGGLIQGIGAVGSTELGYFDRVKKEYLRKRIDDSCELVSFLGNITFVDDRPAIHAHATITDSNFNTLSGHFFSGIITVTGEFYLREFKNRVHRKIDENTGLKLMDI